MLTKRIKLYRCHVTQLISAHFHCELKYIVKTRSFCGTTEGVACAQLTPQIPANCCHYFPAVNFFFLTAEVLLLQTQTVDVSIQCL